MMVSSEREHERLDRRISYSRLYGRGLCFVRGDSVKRTTHPASHQPMDPGADKPRTIIEYAGIQVQDARNHIRVVLSGEIPRGVKGGLRIEGFKPVDPERTVWEAAATPSAIYAAQAVADIFFKGDFS